MVDTPFSWICTRVATWGFLKIAEPPLIFADLFGVAPVFEKGPRDSCKPNCVCRPHVGWHML